MGTNMLSANVVMDSSEITVEMQKTGQAEVDMTIVNFGLGFPTWIW